MTNYLLEIGMEEIPARFLTSIQAQFQTLISTFLQDERLTFESIDTFATPRRIAVRVNGIAQKQEDIQELVKGPSVKIAQDNQGNWTKAALGFVKGQGAQVEDIKIDDVKGEAYIFVNKYIKGLTAKEILQSVPKVLNKFNFPVSMRWGSMDQTFIRPIHWMVSLLDDVVVPFDFFNISASNQSQGHRFLGKEVIIEHADVYEEALLQEYVIVDFNKRQELIRQQIIDIAQSQNWDVLIDDDLLEEVTAIVEWPTAFFGEFDREYLQIPSMISVTAMRDHQRYFYVLDKDSQELLPNFISVRNGNDVAIDNVIKGNLKVLTARLEDALFFYQEDLKQPLSHYVDKLSHVKEHFKLGTLEEKQVRVGKIIVMLADVFAEISADAINVAQKASEIYKFDLMTNTVGEFSELQGQIGGIFAAEYGQDRQVAQAISQQYLPSSSGGQLPDTEAGAVLSIADKIDTVAQYFSVDMVPTGSNDPYALRRQTMGLVEIIAEFNWTGDLKQLIETYQEKFEIGTIKENMVEFIHARVSQYLSNHDIDYDIIDAVLHVPHLNIIDIIHTAKTIQKVKQADAQQYRQIMEAMTRIVNLGQNHSAQGQVQLALAQTISEREMLTWLSNIAVNSMEDLLKEFSEKLTLIEAYFENNMVNADDENIRANRQLTMAQLSDTICQFMNPKKLVIK